MQIVWIEWAHPDLHDSGPFPVTIAMLMGMYWEGYVYCHEGD